MSYEFQLGMVDKGIFPPVYCLLFTVYCLLITVMEALAYTHAYATYEAEISLDVDCSKGVWGGTAFPSSAWLNLLAVAVWIGMLSSPKIALSNPQPSSPDDDMLRGLTAPNAEKETSLPQSPTAPRQHDNGEKKRLESSSAAQSQNNSVSPNSNLEVSTPPNDDMLRGLTNPAVREEGLDSSPIAPQSPNNAVRRNSVQLANPSPEAAKPQPTEIQDSPQTVEPVNLEPDFFYEGVNRAMEAAQLTQRAQTQAQWNVVGRKWQQAIAAMRSVPPNNRDYALAQEKVPEYQANLSYAQNQAMLSRPAPQARKPQPTATPTQRQSPQNTDFFYEGVNRAMEAAQLTQRAQTQAQWNVVVQKWQQAIAAMRSVPLNSRDYALAQEKIPEYQANLSYAQNQAMPSRPAPQAVKQPTATPTQPRSPSPQVQESPQNVEPSDRQMESFSEGVKEAMQAAQLTQTAQTQGQWDRVVEKWQRAIAAMRSVPPNSRDYALAQEKISEYELNLKYAQQMPNVFRQGVSRAMQAVQLGQQAKTQGQWQMAAQQWQHAIAAMESVSPEHPQFAIAQQKIVEYNYYLDNLKAKLQSVVAPMTLKHAIRSSKLSPKSVVYSGRGRFFVQNMMYSHTITVYNQQYELIKTISDAVDLSKYGHNEFSGTYRGAPVEAAFSHGGQYAWVSNYQMYGSGFGNPGSDRCSPQAQHDPSFVYRINTDTLNIENVIQVGSVPKYVAATPDNRLVLVSNWCSWDLSIVDTEQNQEIRRIPLGAYPRGITVDGNSGKAYVAVMGSSDIAIVNLRDFSVRWMRNVGAGPRHLNLSPDNRYLYASLNSEGAIAKIDLSAIDLTKNSNVDGNIAKVRTGSAPRSMILSADGQFLYVVNYYSNTISKVRTSDLNVLQSLPTDTHPIGITYDPDTRQIWVVCYSGSILIFQD